MNIEKIIGLRMKSQDWIDKNPVLGPSHIGIEIVDDTERKIKLGNGIQKWSELPYIEEGTVTPGTLDYNALNNRPSINNILLTGNRTLNELNIASKDELEETNDNIDTLADLTDELQSAVDYLLNIVSIRGSVPTYADIPDPTDFRINDAYIVEADENHNGITAIYCVVDDGGINKWIYLSQFIVDLSDYYTKDEVDDLLDDVDVDLTDYYNKTEVDELFENVEGPKNTFTVEPDFTKAIKLSNAAQTVPGNGRIYVSIQSSASNTNGRAFIDGQVFALSYGDTIGSGYTECVEGNNLTFETVRWTHANSGIWYVPHKIIWATSDAAQFHTKLIGSPDHDNMESINRITANNGEWKNDIGDGYMLIGSASSSACYGRVFINDEPFDQFYMSAGYLAQKIIGISKGQTVRYSITAGAISQITAKFIPPKAVAPIALTGVDMVSSTAPGKINIDPITKTASINGEEEPYKQKIIDLQNMNNSEMVWLEIPQDKMLVRVSGSYEYGTPGGNVKVLFGQQGSPEISWDNTQQDWFFYVQSYGNIMRGKLIAYYTDWDD